MIGVGQVDFEKLGFKLSIIEAEHNHTQLFSWIFDTYNILWICAWGESYAVR